MDLRGPSCFIWGAILYSSCPALTVLKAPWEYQKVTTPCLSGIAHSETRSRSIIPVTGTGDFTELLWSQHSCFVTRGNITFSVLPPVKRIYLDDT